MSGSVLHRGCLQAAAADRKVSALPATHSKQHNLRSNCANGALCCRRYSCHPGCRLLRSIGRRSPVFFVLGFAA
jgi:hypothetical protein